jgi:regulator of protease activity HflC (stomatin/prohibitin superfamily)
MRSLGRPNREQVVTVRPEQLSTLQALDLANGEILANLLARGAANMLKAKPKATADELTEMVFLQALSRKPNAEELAAARELIGEEPSANGLADLLWVVVMLPEFQLVR